MNTSLRSQGNLWVDAVYYHPDKSCDHKHCGTGDIFLICHVTSRDHMCKGLCEIMDGSPSR